MSADKKSRFRDTRKNHHTFCYFGKFQGPRIFGIQFFQGTCNRVVQLCVVTGHGGLNQKTAVNRVMNLSRFLLLVLFISILLQYHNHGFTHLIHFHDLPRSRLLLTLLPTISLMIVMVS